MINVFEFCITRPMGWIIWQIYNLVANYGLAIILFTIVIKLILLPLNIKSQKSMRKQQKIQPFLAELQQKYANDKEKLQQETMKLYKQNNVSMTGGCLPMLLQFPILIGLYQVIYKPLKYMLGVDITNSAVIDHAAQLAKDMVAAGHNIGTLAGQSGDKLLANSEIQLSQWAQTLHDTTYNWAINFNFCGLDLSRVPKEALECLMKLDFSQPRVLALVIIPVLAVAAAVLTNKVTMKQTGQTSPADNGTAGQMSKMMYWMMPIMTLFFTFTLPAGLGIYWIISSITQILQQLLLNYYFDKKGEDEDVRVIEKKQLHSKKRKKR